MRWSCILWCFNRTNSEGDWLMNVLCISVRFMKYKVNKCQYSSIVDTVYYSMWKK